MGGAEKGIQNPPCLGQGPVSLSLRDYARAQLQRKLEREAGSELARETVERLERAGLLNDGAYARRLARDMVERRHFSRRRTLQELTACGLDRETAEEAVEELEPDDAEQALELLRKKNGIMSYPIRTRAAGPRPLWHGRALAGCRPLRHGTAPGRVGGG